MITYRQCPELYPSYESIISPGRPVHAICPVPGSKSISNRALVLAALGAVESPCQLEGLLASEDTEVMVDSLRRLGWEVSVDWNGCRAVVSVPKSVRRFFSGGPPSEKADLFVGNSGTTMRFLAAICSLGHGEFRLDGVDRMRARPLGDLLEALKQVGAKVECELELGFPPVSITGKGWQSGLIHVSGSVSSQFLSGLLLAATASGREIEIRTTGALVSEPYVGMTLRMIRQWGGKAQENADGCFHLSQQKVPCIQRYQIEPDASSATYFWAIAAITGGDVLVPGLGAESLQGDVAFVDCLERMGCLVSREEGGIRVRGRALRGITVDMNAISDTVMTLAVVALFAVGETRILRVGHIRHKETDRLAAICIELNRLGVRVEDTGDGLVIYPGPLRPARVKTYKDHRMAMSLALVGLRLPGLEVDDPGCVAKTYPGFWIDLRRALGSGTS